MEIMGIAKQIANTVGVCHHCSVSILRAYILLSLQLLSDASGRRLELHNGDALNFDMEKLCGP